MKDGIKLRDSLKIDTIDDSAPVVAEKTDAVTTDENGIDMNMLSSFLQMKNMESELKNKLQFIHNKKNIMCADGEDVLAIIEARLATIPLDLVKNFDDKQVEEILTINGKSTSLPIENKSLEKSYRKDFLIYLKETAEFTAKIDEALKNIDLEIEKFNEEYKKIADEYGDMNKFMQDRMRSALESNEVSEEEKNSIRDMLLYTEYGFTLQLMREELEEYVSEHGIRLLMKRYTRSLSDDIAMAHDIILKHNGVSMDIPFHLYQDIEIKKLPEKYHEYRNLFLYLISRWILNNRNNLNKLNIIFLAQLFYNIQGFYSDRFSEEYINNFKNNIISLLDIIINKIEEKKKK